MTQLKRITILATVTIFISAAASARASSETDQIGRQIREYSLQERADHGERILDDVEMPTTSAGQALKLVASLGADGSWGDVDYAGHARSAWEPGDHLTRMLSIIVRARRSGTSPADSVACVAGVHRALAFWIARDFKCPNWWYNEIGGPKILGNIAILLGGDLQPDELKYIADTVLARSKVGAMTGQNRVWLAGNGIMRAVLNHDQPLLEKAAGVIEDEINVSHGDEGIQPDWSFHQHGPQQQFGNYGMAYAVEMSRWATVLRGTRFAIDPEKIAIVRNYLLQGQAWITWRDMMDISSCGRQLMPNSQQRKSAVIAAAMRSMATADVDHAKDYLAFVSRAVPDSVNDLVGNRIFWRSDDVVHRRPDFAATLKMSSNRVIGGETVNSENLAGARLADGALYLYRTGHEYENIFPVWDWRKLPGTTSAQDNATLSWAGKSDRARAPNFVGGASDGNNGCAAMDFHRSQMTAKKAWFFAGDTIVCLGTDITSPENAPVLTTVNQCLLAGPVMVDRHGKTDTFTPGVRPITDADWVEHDGLRYVFPVQQSLLVSTGPKTGNWHTVYSNPSTPKADVTKDVFTVSIDHGASPKGGSYAYYIVPATRAEENVRIVANDEKNQAIEAGPHWAGAVFWTSGNATLCGISVGVDQRCALLMDSTGGTPRVTVADPTEKLKELTVTVGGKAKIVTLPGGGEAGKSIAVQ